MLRKRLLSILLTLCMVLSMVPSAVLATGSQLPFQDVKPGDWFYEAVEYVYEKGMMNGVTNTKFGPEATTTRGMIVTILYRLEGEPVAERSAFADVKADIYYALPIGWASANGIVKGHSAEKFGPEDEITREQMAAILYRYAQYKGYDVSAAADLSSFADAGQISSYAKTPLAWANAVGLVNGVGNHRIAPLHDATRAQVAAILMRFCENVAREESYTVSFQSNGGSAVESQVVSEGMTARQPQMPYREGFAFRGWYLDEELTQPYDFATPVTADLVLYAKWEAGDASYVTFMLNDGTDSAYLMELVAFGSPVERPEDPSMELYGFRGWFTEPEATHAFDFSTPITGTTFLYAGWGAPDGDDSDLYAANSGGGTTYSVTGIEMGEGQVTATVNTDNSAILVVRFYADTQELYKGDFATDSDAPALLSAVSIRTPDYCEMVPIIMPVEDVLPEYYYITADLYNDLGDALCSTFVSVEETSLYTVFEEKTVEDFSSDLVLQYTDSDQENFGVLSENVKHILSNDSINTLTVTATPAVVTVTEDDTVAPVDDRTYTFANPDASLLALQVGDSVYITGTSYLFKIHSITREDGKLILTESKDVEITDFYQYINVDMVVQGQPEDRPTRDPRGAEPYAWDVVDASPSFQLGGEIHWKPKDWLELSGGVSVTGQFHLKVVYDLKLFQKDYLYIEATVDAEFKLTGNVNVSIDNEDSVEKKTEKTEYDIFKVGVPTPIAGLTIEIKPSVPIELEAKASFNFEYTNKMTTGFKYSSYDGKQNIDDKESAVKLYFQGEASAKIGPKLKISIAFCKSVLEAGINAGVGVILNVKTNEIGVGWTNAEEKHGCSLCIEGTAKWYVEVYADVTYCVIKDILEGELGKWYIIKLEGNFPISPNFYLSLINSRDSYFEGKVTFGWGECPNTCYRTTFLVQDTQGQELEDITVEVVHDRTGVSRDGKTPYHVYLYKGSYTAKATINGTAVSKSVSVTGGAQEIILTAKSSDGTVYGKVINANTGEAVWGAQVVVSQNNINIASTETDESGAYQVKLADGTYLITICKEGYQTFRDHVTIANAVTSYLQTTQLVPEESDNGRGGFSGSIVDSVTGNPLANVRLEIREGWNHPDEGEIIDVLYTDAYGEFYYELRNFLGIPVGLKPGEYTLNATKDGYTPTSHNITVVAGEVKGGQGFSMSPKLESDQYRIVLSWGARPSDLDSHLVAPVPDGGTFHLYYPYAETNSSHYYTSYFTLDLDDVTSYGPETTTIKQVTEGKYYFFVHNYSGESPIITSGAKVDVYFGDSQLTFNVPLDQEDGAYWNVFVLDTVSNIITPVNTITDYPEGDFNLGYYSLGPEEQVNSKTDPVTAK